MKFQCDRCKTRYSIADEKIRGKVLKIRCKTCSAVISVREGMDVCAGDRASASLEQALERASAQPHVPGLDDDTAEASPPSAAETVVTARPPVEAEWFIASGGVSSGPLTLEDACQRVALRRPGQVIDVWRDGFDDWELAEEVPEFAAVARRPRAVPPPTPVLAGSAAPASVRERQEGVAAAARSGGVPAQVAAPVPASPSASGAGARSGAGAHAGAVAGPASGAGARSGAGAHAGAVAGPASAATPIAALGPTAVPARAPAVQAPAPALAQAPALAVAPAPAPALAEAPAASLDAASASAVALAAVAAARASSIDDTGAAESLRFEISEPSRVINLKVLEELARAGRNANGQPIPGMPPAALGGVGRGTGSVQSLLGRDPTGALRFPRDPTGALRVGRDPTAQLRSPSGEIMLRPEVAAAGRRRATLFTTAAVGVLAATVLVVLLAIRLTGGNEPQVAAAPQTTENPFLQGFYDTGGFPGGARAKATEPAGGADPGSRPDNGPKVGTSGGARPGAGGKAPSGGTATTGQATGNERAGSAPAGPEDRVDTFTGGEEELRPLGPEDIQAAYQNNKIAIKWCYEHALKQDPGLNVSRLDVTISITADGAVSQVSMPQQQSMIGTCISEKIRRWRFRKSTGPLTTQFPLIFNKGN